MPQTLPSKLLPALFEPFNETASLTVFDIGPATTETLHFFSQYKCRLHFADLLADPAPTDPDGEISEEALAAHYREVIALPATTKLDICLFWDCLNYLDATSLRVFSKVLQPFIHAGTQAHGFGVINSRTKLENRQYAIQDINTLLSKPRQEPQLRYYPHSQQQLNETLCCFTIGKGILMADGRLEVLLKAVRA